LQQSKIQGHLKLASSESYRQVEEIEAAEPVEEVVAPALGLQALLSPLPGHLSHSTEALAKLGLERAHFLDRNRRSPTSLMFKQERFSTLDRNMQNMQNM
jgi:hypothetical protein